MLAHMGKKGKGEETSYWCLYNGNVLVAAVQLGFGIDISERIVSVSVFVILSK